MPNMLRKPSPSMTVTEFLAWPGDGTGRRLQLVDGDVRAMSPASAIHAMIQANLAYQLQHHKRQPQAVPFWVGTEPGILTRVRADINVRVPDIAVTCTPVPPNQQVWPDPVVLVEILSPGNAEDTWENVWSYCTIPSVREIAVIHSTRVLAELLRRGSDGHWPERTVEIGAGGTLPFESIGFGCPVIEAYSGTHLGF